MNNALLNRARDLWGTLALRERQLAAAAAILLGMILLYVLLWAPLRHEVTRLRSGVPDARAQLARMRTQAASIPALRGRTAMPPPPGMLASVVEQSANGRGLRKQITHLEPDGGNGLQITAESIAFNGLLEWLTDLRDNNALVVDNLSLDAASASGAVNARIRLHVATP
jgi:type II secretory pathway component PulM